MVGFYYMLAKTQWRKSERYVSYVCDALAQIGGKILFCKKRFGRKAGLAPKNFYNSNSSVFCSKSVVSLTGAQQSTFIDKLAGLSNSDLETLSVVSP
jgi:hypothetical protein